MENYNEELDHDRLLTILVNNNQDLFPGLTQLTNQQINDYKFTLEHNLNLGTSYTDEFSAFRFNLYSPVDYKQALLLSKFCKDNNISMIFNTKIDKKVIEETLENTEVMYCEKVNNPYVTFR
jgi:hypothetical protein